MSRYIPLTENDKEVMLKSLNITSLDNLFDDIPNSLKLKRDLNLKKSMSEIEITNYMKSLALKNLNTNEYTCFLGAGAYDHYIPSVVNHISSRSEFYTAYTPYQPEISQGTLQVIFEYQSMISNITGMDVSNASMYDGPTACAEAAIMSTVSTRRNKVLVSKTVHPEIRLVLKTYMKSKEIEVVEIDENEGVTDIEILKQEIDKDTAGLIVQYPNFFGIIEDFSEIEKIIHENKSNLIMSVDPISLGILKKPGEIGADIVVGEGQSLGNNLSFGGPYLGFLATTKKLMRKMPGRIVGQSEDVDGQRAFVLTLQAREQHIRRYKATSNICSNQSLNALRAAVYLITLGKSGLREVATQSTIKAHKAYEKIIKNTDFKPVFNKPFFKEFVLKSDIDNDVVNKKLLENKIIGGYDLSKDYNDYKNSLLFCVTEKRSEKEIENLVKVMEVIK